MVENHHSGPFEAIRYAVRFPEPHTHYAEVEAILPAGEADSTEIFLPVWTPGSYLIREYARNIEAISARDAGGRALPIRKSRKNRWLIGAESTSELRVTYRVYCREMSVRTNWVEESFALLNGAPTFVARVGGLHIPCEVRLELPAHWSKSISGMRETERNTFWADDYDALVDCPILCGNPATYEFHVDGIPHVLANSGDDHLWDTARAVADVELLVRRHRDFWGALPYEKYVFLNLLTDSGGGLEHRNSMCILAGRGVTKTRRTYSAWLNLVSHEFFHVWNAKRLRPVELGPFDYENENYTRSLWFTEGFTDYYGPLLAARAGLHSRHEYLGNGTDSGSLSSVIASLQNTPGRLVQSAEEASWDAWIRLYRPDENSRNTSISYYTKGAVVAWLLDARIRRATAGRRSLDDLMRLAWSRFSGERGFTSNEIRQAAEEIAGASLCQFFERCVESTEELDYAEALDWFGLRFRRSAAGAGRAWIGAETKIDAGRLIISRIVRHTPAWVAGLNVDDEILALDGYRIRPDQWPARLERYEAGTLAEVLVARREKLAGITVTMGEESANTWQLEICPDATLEQRAHLDTWLAG